MRKIVVGAVAAGLLMAGGASINNGAVAAERPPTIAKSKILPKGAEVYPVSAKIRGALGIKPGDKVFMLVMKKESLVIDMTTGKYWDS
jgi:hypothetical protein